MVLVSLVRSFCFSVLHQLPHPLFHLCASPSVSAPCLAQSWILFVWTSDLSWIEWTLLFLPWPLSHLLLFCICQPFCSFESFAGLHIWQTLMLWNFLFMFHNGCILMRRCALFSQVHGYIFCTFYQVLLQLCIDRTCIITCLTKVNSPGNRNYVLSY